MPAPTPRIPLPHLEMTLRAYFVCGLLFVGCMSISAAAGGVELQGALGASFSRNAPRIEVIDVGESHKPAYFSVDAGSNVFVLTSWSYAFVDYTYSLSPTDIDNSEYTLELSGHTVLIGLGGQVHVGDAKLRAFGGVGHGWRNFHIAETSPQETSGGFEGSSYGIGVALLFKFLPRADFTLSYRVTWMDRELSATGVFSDGYKFNLEARGPGHTVLFGVVMNLADL